MVAFGMDVQNATGPISVKNSRNQKDMGILNDQTIEKCDTVKNAGYTMFQFMSPN